MNLYSHRMNNIHLYLYLGVFANSSLLCNNLMSSESHNHSGITLIHYIMNIMLSIPKQTRSSWYGKRHWKTGAPMVREKSHEN